MAARIRASAIPSSALTPAESAVFPAGSDTTATSGATSPPLPYALTIWLLAMNASVPGRLNCCSNERLAGPIAATPASVSTAQMATTSFL
jgi:hypothetical protein